MPKLSVIVPAYGVKNYLEKCLNSILAQTYQDMEILVIDDGSRDGSGQLADEMAKIYPQLRVIHKTNEGLPQARRTGVENAIGEFIGFVDGDDYIEPDMYALLMDLILRYDADIACANFFWESLNGKRHSQQFKSADKTVLTVEETISGIHRMEDVCQFLWNKVYKKTLFEGVDYPTGNPVGEDYCILVQLLQKSKTVAQSNRPVYHYIQRKNSMCHKGYTPEREYSLSLYRHWRAYLVEKFPEAKQDIIPYHLREELVVIVGMGRSHHIVPTEAKRIQADTRDNILLLLRSNLEITTKVAGFLSIFSWRFLIGYGMLKDAFST